MGHASRDVATVQVRIGTHVGAVILADDLSDTMMATRRMTDLATAAGDALARAVREQR
jgi:class 3 adenylate cyclase